MIVLYDTYTIITMYNSYVHIYIYMKSEPFRPALCLPLFCKMHSRCRWLD